MTASCTLHDMRPQRQQAPRSWLADFDPVPHAPPVPLTSYIQQALHYCSILAHLRCMDESPPVGAGHLLVTR